MSVSSDIRERTIGIVKDDAAKLVNPGDYDRNINAAIYRYSKSKPDTKVIDVTGNGSHDYSLPTGWIDGFSSILSIEYPKADVPVTLLDSDEYAIYQDLTAKKIRLINYSPSASDSFRITFTVPRTTTTIPDGDVDALCNLAASFCLQELANAYKESSDSTIGADSVNYRTKSMECAARAKDQMRLYKEHFGIKEDDTVTPASTVTDMDMKYPGGGERLTHPRRYREKR